MVEKLVIRNLLSHVYIELKQNDDSLLDLIDEVYMYFGENSAVELIADLLESYRYGIDSRQNVLDELYHMQFPS